MKEKSSDNLQLDSLPPYIPIIGWVILICDLVVTVSFWFFVSSNATTEALGRFQFRSHEIEVAIKERLSAYEQVLKGGVGLFESSQLRVDREMFKIYVEKLNIDERYRGIQGIGFSISLSPNEIGNHIREIRESGFPDYTIKPEGRREQYTSVIYLEPFSGRNLRAFGYDMFSEPNRRNAMKQARDTGKPSISGKITLVQETGEDIQTGFLMYLPVYKNKMPLRTVEERRAALFGYVYSPFRTRDFLEGVLGQRKIPEMAFGLFDGSEPKEQSLLYKSNPGHNANSSIFQENLTIEFNDHIWSLELSSLEAFENSIDKEKSIAVLIIGLLVSLVFFSVLWLTHTSRNRAVEVARKINENLNENEERLKMALDGNNDGIWDWNVQTGEVYFSPRWMTMLGYEPDELPGNVSTWAKLVHPDDKPWVMEVLNDHLEGQTPFYMTEHRVKTKSGEYIWILDRGKVFSKTPDGKPQRATGTHTDITQRKLIEQELETYKNSLEDLVKKRTQEVQKTLIELRESEERLRLTFEATTEGFWDWNIKTGEVIFSSQWFKALGYEPNELPGHVDTWKQLVHPDDMPEVMEKLNAHFEGRTKFYECENRLKTKPGAWQWNLDRGKVVARDSEGNPTRMVGTDTDITKQKKTEGTLLKNQEKFRLLYRQISQVIKGTSSATSGEKFFQSLVFHLASILGFDFCFVASLDKQNTEIFNTLAFFMDGKIIENTQFKLHNTPCGVLYQGTVVFYLDNLQEAFPEDMDIEKFGLKSYIGVPIFGNNKNPIAHLVVMDRKPVKYSAHVMSILSLFATRAAAELTRIEIKNDLRTSQERLRKLNKKIQTVREEEKLYLAREIHDELGQVITYCKLDLLWVKKELNNPGEKIGEKFESMVFHLDETLRKVRTISSELRPETLDVLGLSEAIKWQVKKFKDQTNIKCELDIVPEKIDCERGMSIDIFRIFQETLTNISRHAEATSVRIEFVKEKKCYKLFVDDNGKGFDATWVAHSQSLGILGMKERALNWEGQVNIESKPGTGTTVTVTLPIKNNHDISASK
jgi:PAS domain S-box-containing protein